MSSDEQIVTTLHVTSDGSTIIVTTGVERFDDHIPTTPPVGPTTLRHKTVDHCWCRPELDTDIDGRLIRRHHSEVAK